MAVSGFLEILTTLLSWQMYTVIWEVFVATGLAIVPFITIMWQNLKEAREKRNKLDAGVVALRVSEIQVYLAIVVIALCCQPLVTIATNDVIYTTYSCDFEGNERRNEEHTLNNTQTSLDSLNTATIFNGEEVRAPIWWTFTNNLFRGITAQVITGIPCNLDVVGVGLVAENIGIKDPALRSEAIQFGRECWIPARNQYYREQPSLAGTVFEGAPDLINSDLNWMGSRILRVATNYYASWQSSVPVASFAFDPERDSGHQDPEYATYGFPYCDEWFNSFAQRVVNSEPGNSALDWLRTSWGGLAGYSGDDRVLYHMLQSEDINSKSKAWLSNDFSHNPGIFRSTAGTVITDAGATLGLDFLSGGHYTKMRVVRDAAPMIQALLLMMIVIALPIVLVFSEYSIRTVMTMTFIQFGVIFWSFLFALAYWLDNNLAAGMVQNDTRFLGVINGPQDKIRTSILLYISATFYMLLPIVFTAIMTWAGINVGKTAAVTADGATRDPGNAGAKGTDTAVNAGSEKVAQWAKDRR